MPRRMITPEIWRNEKVASLSDAGRLLFIGIFSSADDDGRLKASPGFLKATIFPYDDDKTKGLVKHLRDQCAALGLIRLYTNGTGEYLDLPGWKEHQQIRQDRYKPSPLPAYTNQMTSTGQPTNNQLTTSGQPNSNHWLTQSSIVESSIVESSIEGERVRESSSPVKNPRNSKTKQSKKKYGEFSNVLLSLLEHQKLVDKFGEHKANELIENLSFYIQSKGSKYKSHYATILNWERRNKEEGNYGAHRGDTQKQGALPTKFSPPPEYSS